MKKSEHKIFRLDKAFMDLGRALLFPLLLVYRNKKTYVGSKDEIKNLGGFLVVANHIGYTDPMILETSFWTRRLHYVVAEVVMTNKFRNFFMKGAGCIRIDRNITDTKAIKDCVAVLKEGFPIAIFPQGGIGDEDGKFKLGTALIANFAKAPMVPVYIKKRKNILARQEIIIGRPLLCSDVCDKKMPSVQDLEEITEELYKRYKEAKEKSLGH